MPSPILPPGMISAGLITELQKTIVTVVDGAQEHLAAQRDLRDGRWEQWCLKQPAGQRSYLRAIRKQGRAWATISFANGIDHAQALADLLDICDDHGVRAWAYLTVARGAMEGFIRAAVLDDLSTPPDRHVLRWAATSLEGWQEQRRLAEDYTDAKRTAADKQIAAEVRRCERAGIVIHSHKGKMRYVERDGARENLAINLTDEAGKRLPEFPSPYPLGSAVAHSAGWFLMTSVRQDDGGELKVVADPDLVFSSAALVVFSLLEATRAVTLVGREAGFEAIRDDARRGLGKALAFRQKDHGLGPETASKTDRRR